MPARDRIYVSKAPEVQSIYEKLKEERGEEGKKAPTKPFRFDRETFLAATAIGYANGKYVELESADRKERFLWGTLLSDPLALPALRTIALLHTNEPEVLLDDDRVASIAEAYANGGIHLLAEKLTSAVDELEETIAYLNLELQKVPVEETSD
jgi:hypothetical protein